MVLHQHRIIETLCEILKEINGAKKREVIEKREKLKKRNKEKESCTNKYKDGTEGYDFDNDFYVVFGKQCRTENAYAGHQQNIFI